MVSTPSYAVEPSSGEGVFIRDLRLFLPVTPIYSIDIRPETTQPCYAAGSNGHYVMDYCAWVDMQQTAIQSYPGPVLITGNPPFKFAAPHILKTLSVFPTGSHIAFLLKQNFFGSTKRAKFFWPHGQLKYFIPFDGRPNFIDGEEGNDMNEYATFIWEVGYAGKPTVEFPHIEWKNEVV